jgi:hypothetical protein
MSNVDSNHNKKAHNQVRNNYYLIWLVIYMTIGLVISYLLPFPLSFAVVLIGLLLLTVLRVEVNLRREGIGGIKGLYKSLSSSRHDSDIRRYAVGDLAFSPKFYCLNCGYEHREYSCPRCGSKVVRTG